MKRDKGVHDEEGPFLVRWEIEGAGRQRTEGVEKKSLLA